MTVNNYNLILMKEENLTTRRKNADEDGTS